MSEYYHFIYEIPSRAALATHIKKVNQGKIDLLEQSAVSSTD